MMDDNGSSAQSGQNILDSSDGNMLQPTGVDLMSTHAMASFPFQSTSLGVVTPQESHLQQFHQQQQQQTAMFQPPIHPNLFAEQVIASMHLQQEQNRLQQQQLAMLQLGYALPNPSHNLIPSHAQGIIPNNGSFANLSGTPGYPSALIQQHPLHQTPQLQIPMPLQLQQASLPISGPPNLNTASLPSTILHPVYTVQDRPTQMPVFNGVNPSYPGLRVVSTNPPMFCVDNFLTDFECEFLIQHAQDSFGPAPVVGKGAGEVSPSRTSSTCYLAREDLPDALRKVSYLTGKPIEHCELPQVGRYLPSQQYLQHYDAFDMRTEDGRRFASNGGQRTITVLIYLNTVTRGGATRFPALNLDVQPVRGMALVFFPATVDGLLDQMALHAALPAIDVKYVSQIWIRQSVYTGQPSKRLPQTLGVPFGQEHLIQQPQQQVPNLGLYSQLGQQQPVQDQATIPLQVQTLTNFVEPW